MHGIPKKKAAELAASLPARLPGGTQANVPDPAPNPIPGGLEHHAPPPDLASDVFQRAGADAENRALARALKNTFDTNKTISDGGVPRFLFTWRMYPNGNNPHTGVEGQCGCGCGCA
jgi:hypothetical protein